MFNQNRIGRLMYNESVRRVYLYEGAAATAAASTSTAGTRMLSGGASSTSMAQTNVTGNYTAYGSDTILTLASADIIAIALNFGDVLIQTTATVSFGVPFRISYGIASANCSATWAASGSFIGEVIVSWAVSASETTMPNRIAAEPNTICNGFTLTTNVGNSKAAAAAVIPVSALIDFLANVIYSGNYENILTAALMVTVLVYGWDKVITPQDTVWEDEAPFDSAWTDIAPMQTAWKKVN